MPILTDSGGAQLTTNAGKVLLRDTGSILRVSYGDTMTPTTIENGSYFQPTALAASIITTASTTGIIIYVSSKVDYVYQADNVGKVETDIMVIGGASYPTNTVLSGSPRGFASAFGYLVGSDGIIAYTNASFNFLHNHGQAAGTTLTYTVCGRGEGRWNSGGYNPNNGENAKSTIILMEVSQ